MSEKLKFLYMYKDNTMSMKEMIKDANEKNAKIYEDGKELYNEISEGRYGELSRVDENLYSITINVSFDIDRYINCLEYRIKRDIENNKMALVNGFDDNEDNIVITDIGLFESKGSEFVKITFKENK